MDPKTALTICQGGVWHSQLVRLEPKVNFFLHPEGILEVLDEDPNEKLDEELVFGGGRRHNLFPHASRFNWDVCVDEAE